MARNDEKHFFLRNFSFMVINMVQVQDTGVEFFLAKPDKPSCNLG